MSKLKDSFKDNFRAQAGHEADICGAKVTFYPNRAALIPQLRQVSEPVVKALATLFWGQDAQGHHRTKFTSGKDEMGEDMRVSEEEFLPPPVEHLRAAQEAREAALKALFDALTGPSNRIALGALLMDSMREEFEYERDRNIEEVLEFLDGDKRGDGALTVDQLLQMIFAWTKANMLVFGEVGKKIALAMKAKVESVARAVSKVDETTGETSKKPSSKLSDLDSMPSTSSDSTSSSSED